MEMVLVAFLAAGVLRFPRHGDVDLETNKLDVEVGQPLPANAERGADQLREPQA